jgi:hypothetical protein
MLVNSMGNLSRLTDVRGNLICDSTLLYLSRKTSLRAEKVHRCTTDASYGNSLLMFLTKEPICWASPLWLHSFAMRTFFRNHGLSLAMLGLFLGFFLIGQVYTGRKEYNDEREKAGQSQVELGEYLRSAHFVEATAENWESEFLQMAVYVFATAWLYQKGSAESKDPRKRHRHHSTRAVTATSPWPARRGGWVLRLYEHSLSLAFFFLFAVAFVLHALGGQRLYNEERLRDGEPALTLIDYLASARFWFESFQNWQSEFLAIGSMVVLSIFLREVNSPESKHVQTPHWENEE